VSTRDAGRASAGPATDAGAATGTGAATGLGSAAATHTRFDSTQRGGTFASVAVWRIRAWHRLVTVSTRASRWLRETVTPAGWLAVGAALLLPVGVAFGWIELVAAAMVGIVLLVVAIPFLFGARAFEVELGLEAERVVAGDVVAGTVRVTNASKRIALPGRIDIPTGKGIAVVHVPLLRSGAVSEQALTIAARQRGVIRVGPARSVRTDPLGILKRELAWADLRDIFVHPVTVPIPSTNAGFLRDLEGVATNTLVESDISFNSIREYAVGDAERHIHWKSTAKTSKLMVRQFEETRRTRLAIVLSLDESEFESPDEFELAVSAVGSLGVRAIRDARDLAVVTSEEIPEFVSTSMQSVRSLGTVSTRILLDDLSLVDSGSNVMAIERVCTLAAQVVTDMSVAFVVCGSRMTVRRLQSIAASFPLNVSVVAVMCSEFAQPSFRRFGTLTIITVALLDDLTQLLARSAR
jgi:hypothetical protein